jgi:hypothetical protein
VPQRILADQLSDKYNAACDKIGHAGAFAHSGRKAGQAAAGMELEKRRASQAESANKLALTHEEIAQEVTRLLTDLKKRQIVRLKGLTLFDPQQGSAGAARTPQVVLETVAQRGSSEAVQPRLRRTTMVQPSRSS